jgi:hypothetical protein
MHHGYRNLESSMINDAVRFLYTPVVKEGIKTIASSVTFAFGAYEVYDLYHLCHQSLPSKTCRQHHCRYHGPASRCTAALQGVQSN